MGKYEVSISKKIDSIWTSVIELVDTFISRSNLARLDECEIVSPAEAVLSTFPMEMFRLKRLAFNPGEGIVDKLVNVYASMHSIGATVFTIIHGSADGGTDFYVGCLDRKDTEASKLLLKSSFAGNFPGIELEYKSGNEKNELLDELFPLDYKKKTVASVSVSADFRNKRAEEKIAYIQGIEKFIDTMKGQDYTAMFLAEPVSQEDCKSKKRACENLITELSKLNKVTVNYSENESNAVNESITEGTSENVSHSINSSISKSTSYSVGKTKGKMSGSSFGLFGIGFNHGRNKGTTKTDTTGSADTSGTSDTTSTGTSSGKTQGTTATTGSSAGMTINIENKTVSNLISKLEYEMKKLEISDSFGLWDCAIYIVSGDRSTPIIAANSIRSLVIGDESGKAESFINYWDNTAGGFTNGAVGKIMQFLHHGMHPVFQQKNTGEDEKYYFTPAITVGGNVLPSIMGLPLKSVPGVTVIESVEFGRNIVTDDLSFPGNRKIKLGSVIYMGKNDRTTVEMYVNSLSMHTFICGAPGSGKSNTVYKMMYELCRLGSKPERDDEFGSVKFLVIEPAKGEYKYEFGKMPNINIFTTKAGLCRMLCIDPFEFPYEKMDVREHIERLKNIISACWPLTAAMPAILSSAIERAFIRCGWDIENSVYVFPGEVRYPDFGDLLRSLTVIIDSSEYSAQSKGDYKGALLTRVESLTKGIPGAVFTNAGAVPDSMLFDENTIIDLSTVGSSEARSLIMGILVMKLENYRKATADRANYPLRHVTILEEAHNLLPRCSTEQSDDSSNMQGKSVESISNAISEMRTYGEGFIIVDQSPSAVAEVAVSNTSTKIIMRLPGENDVRAAGASIGLSDEQCRQIPMLPQGQAIVKQGNWIAPVMAVIDKAPSSHMTRKLRTYEYESLKIFRSELIDKIYSTASRNKDRKAFAAADKNNVIRFIEKQTDVAPNILDKCKAYWTRFCQFDNAQRHIEINRLIVNVLSFEQALTMVLPKSGVEEYAKDDVDEWLDRLNTVMAAYVTADEEEMNDIICSVLKYCVRFSRYKSLRKCSEAAIKMYAIDL